MLLKRALKHEKVWIINRMTKKALSLDKLYLNDVNLMIQGTTTDAGKSTLVAGLCRLLVNHGVDIAPFKPQNMALNSAVSKEGGELGRAQAMQAFACKIDAHTDMNPVLIKPSSDTGAQVIVQGKVLSNMDAQHFHRYKPEALTAVLDSFDRLSAKHTMVLIEGAGSPAEINLRKGDIANMGFAEAANCPVIIVADIDKGGVFAHIVGTLELLSQSERNRVLGFVINKFRGDIGLLTSGLDWLEKRTGKPVYGVLPYLHELYLESEDAVDTQQNQADSDQAVLRVVVPVLPKMSNHTDFDALRLHPQVQLQFVPVSKGLPPCDLLILPGSKSVMSDLNSLKESNWPESINQHLRYGGKVIGICGGFQMLGQRIDDPNNIESTSHNARCSGLGFIPMSSTFYSDKTLATVEASLSLLGEEASLNGYEIHNGMSEFTVAMGEQPILVDGLREEGYLSKDGLIFGCYIHGLFDQAQACDLFLRWAGLTEKTHVDIHKIKEQEIERLAQSLEEHVDIEKLLSDTVTFFDT